MQRVAPAFCNSTAATGYTIILYDGGMIFPLVALPVVLFNRTYAWIEFNAGTDTVPRVATAFCNSTAATGFDQASHLPESTSSISAQPPAQPLPPPPPLTCLEHVTTALEIRLRAALAHHDFLRAHNWTWSELPAFDLEEDRPPPPPPPLRVVHIWIGPAPLPQDYAALAQEWRAKHETSTAVSADIQLVKYPSAREMPLLRTAATATTTTDTRSISDVLRLERLFDHGGIYADADVWPVRPFDRLVDLARQEQAVIFGMESPDVVSNSVIISPFPKHPFLGWLLHNLPAWAQIHGGRRACDRTGPTFLTAAIRWALTVSDRRGVLLVDYRTFNPVHFSALDGSGEKSQDVFARWLRTQSLYDSSMVFGVQGWNSQLAFLPTKIEIERVAVVTTGGLLVSMALFPWQEGKRVVGSGSGWRVCAQELGPHTRQVCTPLPLRQEVATLTVVLLAPPRKVQISRRDGVSPGKMSPGKMNRIQMKREVRAWIEDASGLPLSRSSRTARVGVV